MSKTIIDFGHPTIAIGEHFRRPFRLLASYDGRENAYLVHVYVGDENLPDANQYVKTLKWFTSRDDALDAGEVAAMDHIGGV